MHRPLRGRFHVNLYADNFGEKPMTACVTGASGMIGRRIVQKLLARGCRVRVLTRRNYVNKDVQVFNAGLTDQVPLEEFICGADMVFHCAAELKDESKMQEINVLGTEIIMKLVAQHCVAYFCYLSSAGVVGRTTHAWVGESTPCRPQNTYERTKFAAELIAHVPIEGCSTVILRPTNVVDEDHLGELSLPANESFKNRLKAFIKGGECAHIVHAEDVAEAAIYFSSRPSRKPRLFFVSLDDDPLNMVADLWSLYRANVKDSGQNFTVPLPHLPVWIPYFLRRVSRQTGNRGDVKYSSRQLVSEGFKFKYGVREIVKKIIFDRANGASASDMKCS
jgi:nucleoside-diphosphate-sugar epimerase